MKNNINITFGSNALKNISKNFKKAYTSIFILVDSNTKKYCLDTFMNLTGLNEAKILLMSSGEENKNLKTCEKS